MKSRYVVVVVGCVLALLVALAYGQTSHRTNVIWARATSDPITLDGKLNEAAWAKAESVRVQYGKSNTLIPGSGWHDESGVNPPGDPVDATLKFLVKGNKLYMAAVVKDSSVGGGLFNKFDGFLMNMRSHATRRTDTNIAPEFEYFYGWVTEGWADPSTGNVGASPGFFGFAGGPRTTVLPEGFPLSDIWNAATTVQGVSNDDATPDAGWTTEIEFNLETRSWVLNPQTGERRTSGGYNVTRPEGDIIEFNISIYDADWQWPLQPGRFSGNRTWLQGPWGNASWYDVVRIYARPDVTVNSGPVPEVGPEVIIPNGANYPAPTIDGKLDEPVWQNAPGLDLRYGDDALRASYPANGPYRSGQQQPAIDGKLASVVDPGDATLKWFFKDDMLYLAADVRDQAVWSIDNRDQWDAIMFIINDRAAFDPDDHNLRRWALTVRLDATGKAIRADDLPFVADSLKGASAAVALKPGTTVNNFNDADQGYTVELAIDLTKLGYPAGRGDGVLFLSATLYDGENFANSADNYGTRVWWMREGSGDAGPAWAYMDPNKLITGVAANNENSLPMEFALLGNYPNPLWASAFNPSTKIQFTMPEPGKVTLKVYNVLGQHVLTQQLGWQQPGKREIVFDPKTLSSGVYLYRLEMASAAMKQTRATLYGKMMVIK